MFYSNYILIFLHCLCQHFQWFCMNVLTILLHINQLPLNATLLLSHNTPKMLFLYACSFIRTQIPTIVTQFVWHHVQRIQMRPAPPPRTPLPPPAPLPSIIIQQTVFRQRIQIRLLQQRRLITIRPQRTPQPAAPQPQPIQHSQ